MSIYPQGALNTTALSTPGLYVQIVPPDLLLLNGVPTNIGGLVGTAVWGPVGVPVLLSDPTGHSANFGPMQPRKHDMGTFVSVGSKQGRAGAYACVRVTDGTDLAATGTIQSNGLTLTAKYTGTGGNKIKFLLTNGSAPGTTRAIVSLPFVGSEVFDNLTGTGNAFWLALASAINNGQGVSRSASQLVIAAAGVSTTAPVLNGGATTLTGGTDGATGVDAADLIGSDVSPRTGLFALRGLECSVIALCDADDATTYATQTAFGLSESALVIGVTPPGDTITAASATRNNGGIDTYAFELMFGDWILFYDEVNQLNRYVSPQAFELGKLVNLSPHLTSLNKPMLGIIGTQRSATGAKYSDAELQQLSVNGLSLICNPIPYGNVFGNRFGRNTSSNAGIHQVSYTRLTNYIAQTLNKGMGKYVGELQSRRADDSTRRRATATLNAFIGALQSENMVDDFQVVCDLSNNPINRIALGYMKAAVKVVYLAVVEYFLIDVEGGQTVQITRSDTAPDGFTFRA